MGSLLVLVGFAVLNIILFIIIIVKISKSGDDKISKSGDGDNVSRIDRAVREEITRSREEMTISSKCQREELSTSFNDLTQSLLRNMDSISNSQKIQLESIETSLGKLINSNENKLEFIRATVDDNLKQIQSNNSISIDKMRETVEEKLQGTLEKRLGESFKQVSEQLEEVYKGLGEMHVLANGVGDLKKVLTNVKTRGTWGEIQLGNILEQILTPNQYSKNVATKYESNERVEFAIKLPGTGVKDNTIWLPIDAKFPTEDYQRLIDSQSKEESKEASKKLENRIKSCAKDIMEKYIGPPTTTDFGIMYLPTEGLYAEVAKVHGLIELLQQKYRVIICGPTTLSALVNALQVGFKTLAIQKRSSEVWEVLGAVKSEFGKFIGVLDKVHKKLSEASSTIDDAATRTRAIERKLKNVEELPSSLLLGNDEDKKLEDSEGIPSSLLLGDGESDAMAS
jgi:DNA recombination protein RmuC